MKAPGECERESSFPVDDNAKPMTFTPGKDVWSMS
jgi:hypothetical protein